MMQEGPHMEGPVEYCLEDEARLFIQKAAQLSECFEEFVAAGVDLVQSETLTDREILEHKKKVP